MEYKHFQEEVGVLQLGSGCPKEVLTVDRDCLQKRLAVQ